MALPGEAQGLLAVEVVDALGKGVARHVDAVAVFVGHLHAHGGELIVGVHIHAVQGIHDLLQAREIHPGIVIRLDPVEVPQHGGRFVDAVHTGVSQLIPLPVAGQGHIVVPGGIDQQDLVGPGMDHRQNVHVAEALDIDVRAAGVNAAAIDDEGLGGDGRVGLDGLQLLGGAELIDDAGVLREGAVILQTVQRGEIAGVEDDGPGVAVVQGVGQGGQLRIGGGVHLAAQTVLDVLQQGTGIVGADIGVLAENAEGVAHGVADAAGGIIRHDHHIGGGFLQVLAGDGQQGAPAGGGGHGAVQHQARKDQRQQAAQHLAGFDPADGQLDEHMACVEQQKHHFDDDQIEVRQQLGRHQLPQQHQAADHQQAHGRQAEPIGAGAV